MTQTPLERWQKQKTTKQGTKRDQKGIFILVLPKAMISLTKVMLTKCPMKILAAFIIALGLAVSFLGFCPKSPI